MRRTHGPICRLLWNGVPGALCCALLWWVPATAQALSFAEIADRAKQLASSAYQKPASDLPKELQSLDYDQYWSIRYKPDRVHWRAAKLPFEVSFFHQGMYYDQPVRINEVSPDGIKEIKFDPEAFDYSAVKLPAGVLRNIGLVGFRIRYGANPGDPKDEVLTVLGASYFRGLAKGQHYGSYGRGLALNTGVTSGEEFPRFVEFWLERPGPGSKELGMYALLDSPSATGAYRIVLKPGAETAMEITAQIYLRQAVAKFGIAPLASMFLFGANQRSDAEDFRPEVHNADGLSIRTGSGEWIGRPLVNPKRLLITSFAMTDPAGFGLMQRERSFGAYQDLEARFDAKPSVWVEPKGQWGAGRVELVQIPLPDETNSNIVAYWVPDKPPVPREPYTFEYRVLWQGDVDARPATAWVAQTRRGRGYMRTPDDSIGFIIDFTGPGLKKLPPDAQVEGAVSLDANAERVQDFTYRNPITQGWRTVLRVRRLDPAKPVELRVVLRSGGNPVSEIWSYIIPPG